MSPTGDDPVTRPFSTMPKSYFPTLAVVILSVDDPEKPA